MKTDLEKNKALKLMGKLNAAVPLGATPVPPACGPA